jgi:hypothetical protein
MTAPRPRSPQPKQLDAGIFQAEISSFALRLAAGGQGRQDDPDLVRTSIWGWMSPAACLLSAPPCVCAVSVGASRATW